MFNIRRYNSNQIFKIFMFEISRSPAENCSLNEILWLSQLKKNLCYPVEPAIEEFSVVINADIFHLSAGDTFLKNNYTKFASNFYQIKYSGKNYDL